MKSSACAVPADEFVRSHETISSKCRNCTLRTSASFCNLSAEARYELDRLKSFRKYAPGERLFTEDQPLENVMIVCQGAATLSFASPGGRCSVLGVSEPGEVLGLSAALSGHTHETTADAITPMCVAVLPRLNLLRLLHAYPAAAINANLQLSRNIARAYEKIRLIGAGLSVPQRLAAWLLRTQAREFPGEDRIRITITHQRIAMLLGASRESITRSLSEFRKAGALEVRGIHFYVRNPDYLKSLLHP